MLHQTFNDFILSAMLLTYGIIDLLPQQLRNNQTLAECGSAVTSVAMTILFMT